jgi:hypothetical protein
LWNVRGGNNQRSNRPLARTRHHWSRHRQYKLYVGWLLENTEGDKYDKTHPYSSRCQGALLRMWSHQVPSRHPSCTHHILRAVSFRICRYRSWAPRTSSCPRGLGYSTPGLMISDVIHAFSDGHCLIVNTYWIHSEILW